MSDQNESMLEAMLLKAAELRASDLHLVAGEPPVYRVKDTLQRAEQDPLTAQDIQQIVESQIGPVQAAKIGKELGDISAMCQAAGAVEGRMCITRASGALTVTIRVLPTKLPDPASVGIPQALLDAAFSPYGLIIVAGEAGSGKTTVLLMLLEHINANRPVRIVTIEDPISMRLQSKCGVITQHSIGTDMPSFAAALRACMRQDPDVVLVGEIRDLTTLEACLTAADTGHLVITQLHANSPEGAIQRMIDVIPDENREAFRRRLAPVLRAVSAQKLLPRADKPGRVAAFGLLIPDAETRQAIVEGKDLRARTTPPPASCRKLADDIKRLQAEGAISQQTACDAIASLG